MNLWRLECFVVLARELHFGRAARQLHVSQPALSAQIKLLEEEVGAPLLDRAGGVTLTSVGEALLPEATSILAAVDTMMGRIRSLTGRVVGQLNVHFNRSVSATDSLGLVQQFERSYPHVDVLMQSQWTSFNVEALREGRADVAFVRLPLEDADGLDVLTMGRDEQLLAVPAGHRLAALDRIRDTDLGGERLITWRRDDAPGNFDHLHARWAEIGPTLSDPLPDVAHRLARAAATEALTLISDFAVAELPHQLVARPLLPALHSEWGLAYRTGSPNALVYKFIDLAQSHGETGPEHEIPKPR